MLSPNIFPDTMPRDYRAALIEHIVDPSQHGKQLSPWEEAFKDEMLNRHKVDRLLLNLTFRNRLRVRNVIARQSLRGLGVEIGAQHVPTLTNPAKATVEYVDRLSADDLAVQFALPRNKLVTVTHLIEGSKLDVYADGSRDFLIANHVLEHFDDPVGGIIEWFRILSPGGRLFVTVPNYKSNRFDFRRRPPTKSHFERDASDEKYRVAHNRLHYADMVQSLYQFEDDNPLILATADAWEKNQERHHYHVYDEQAVHDVLAIAAVKMGVRLVVVNSFMLSQGFEYLLVIEKQTAEPSVSWPNPLSSRAASLALLARVAVQDIAAFYTDHSAETTDGMFGRNA